MGRTTGFGRRCHQIMALLALSDRALAQLASDGGSWESNDRATARAPITPDHFEVACDGNNLVSKLTYDGPSEDPNVEDCVRVSASDDEYVACRPADEGPTNPGFISLNAAASQNGARVIFPFQVQAWESEGASFTRISGTPVTF
eukprot:SAG22_NODE_10595_length_526_cov_0.843091_1_plen_144_part_10